MISSRCYYQVSKYSDARLPEKSIYLTGVTRVRHNFCCIFKPQQYYKQPKHGSSGVRAGNLRLKGPKFNPCLDPMRPVSINTVIYANCSELVDYTRSYLQTDRFGLHFRLDYNLW